MNAAPRAPRGETEPSGQRGKARARPGESKRLRALASERVKAAPGPAADTPEIHSNAPWNAEEDRDNRFQDPISERLAEVISSAGEGGKLPSEREMSLTLAVSRNALRDRLRLMEALGVLERRQGAGTFVRPLDPAGLAFALDFMLSSSYLSLPDLHVVRVALERQGAIQAAKREMVADTSVMRRMLGVMAMSLDQSEIIEADMIFHQQLLTVAHNPALTFFADALHGVFRRSLEYRQNRWRQTSTSRELLVAVHEAVVVAVEQQDEADAANAIDRHFEVFSSLVGDPATEPEPGTRVRGSAPSVPGRTRGKR